MTTNTQDTNALTEYWHRETNFVNEKVDAAFRQAQDHAYSLGLARGREEANARYDPRQPLGEGRIDQLADSMPGGVQGFMKQWGWRHFARALEQDHGIVA
jgi:hypothetical protein